MHQSPFGHEMRGRSINRDMIKPPLPSLSSPKFNRTRASQLHLRTRLPLSVRLPFSQRHEGLHLPLSVRRDNSIRPSGKETLLTVLRKEWNQEPGAGNVKAVDSLSAHECVCGVKWVVRVDDVFDVLHVTCAPGFCPNWRRKERIRRMEGRSVIGVCAECVLAVGSRW